MSGTLTANADGGIVTKEVKVIGQMDNTKDHTHESANRVYDVGGCAPTVNTCGGGGLQPKIIDKPRCLNSKGGRAWVDGLQPSLQDRVYDPSGTSTAVKTDFRPSVMIKQATKEGTIECDIGGVADLSYPDSQTRRGRVQGNGQISPTLTASNGDICRIEKYRIRKLTPRECGRLMGVSDEDIDKMLSVCSASQCYKQFGNSIVVQVLEAIFKNFNLNQGGEHATDI